MDTSNLKIKFNMKNKNSKTRAQSGRKKAAGRRSAAGAPRGPGPEAFTAVMGEAASAEAYAGRPTESSRGLAADYGNPYVTRLQRNAAAGPPTYFSQIDPLLQPLSGSELAGHPGARFDGGLQDTSGAQAMRIQNLHQQSYEPALTYPDPPVPPFLQASAGALRHPPSESGFSMARANQRLNAQAMSSAAPSTAAETLNNTHARKSMLGSQVTTEASQMHNCADQQAAFTRSNREALQAAHLENSMMTPGSGPQAGKRQMRQDTASTMHNTL